MKSRNFILSFSCLLILISPLFGEDTPLISSISSVTVYADRALVTRSAVITLQAGKYSLAFNNLPMQLMDNSVRVSGIAAGAKITDVRVQTSYLNLMPEKRISELKTKIEELQWQAKQIADKVYNLNIEKDFIVQIKIQTDDNIGKDLKVQRPTVEDWQKVVSFLNSNLDRTTKEIRVNEKAKGELDQQITALQQQMNAISPSSFKSNKTISVDIEITSPAEIKISAQYVLTGAKWYPQYDVRVFREKNEVQLDYKAMIEQSTGEDWSNIDLTLSTARPDIGGVKPELNPWYISYNLPRKKSAEGYSSGDGVTVTAERALVQKDITSSMSIRGGSSNEQNVTIQQPVSYIENQASTTLFHIPAHSTIPSDNVPHKVTIAIEKLIAEFSYSSTPKLSPYAYVKAEIKNSTEFPFLAGNINVFTDNEFVAQSQIKTIAPSEKFEAYLGIDPSVKIERKLVNKFTERPGTFSKSNKITFEYSFAIENTKKIPVKLSVQDQVPVSQNEKIIVEQIDPEEKQLKPNDYGYLIWENTYSSGEKKTWKLKFSIEYPDGVTLQWID